MTGDSEEPRSKYTVLSLPVRGRRSGIPSPSARGIPRVAIV